MTRALLCLMIIGCKGTIIGEVKPLDESTVPTPGEVTLPVGPTYSAAKCEGVAALRTYHSLTGDALGADRANLAATLDTRRPRSWETVQSYGQDLNRQLGYYLATDGALDLATVPVRPMYWAADAQLGALELYSHFRVGYIVCGRMLAEPNGSAVFMSPELASAPTEASASKVCHDMMRQFWKEEPTTEQVSDCAAFAIDEANVAATTTERWALVCAALISSTGSTTQ